MKLVITIDTEEDNWANYSRTDNPVENIRKIVDLQALFDRYGARPTYLVSYPVATNPESVSILRRILEDGNCEIGAHCHPWNTPPFEEELNSFNTMLCNLPETLILKKLTTLHEAIIENFGVTPVSFRAGRWGFDEKVARSLFTLGYKIDTSVTPFIDWTEYDGPDFSNFQLEPYKFSPDDITRPKNKGTLLEVPATVAYLQGNFHACQLIERYLDNGFLKKLHMKGIMSRVRLLNKVWLSPELVDDNVMVSLMNRIIKTGISCLNLNFHSNSLMEGCSPFVKNKSDEIKILKKIERNLIYAKKNKLRILKLVEVLNE